MLLSAYIAQLATTAHVLVEIWVVTRCRRHRASADALAGTILDRNLAEAIIATSEDIRAALRIGEAFSN